MWSYISGSMSLFFIIWTVSKVGVYHKYYVERTIRFEEARFLIQSDACTDPVRRAVLSDLCMEKQKVLYTKPWLGVFARNLFYVGAPTTPTASSDEDEENIIREYEEDEEREAPTTPTNEVSENDRIYLAQIRANARAREAREGRPRLRRQNAQRFDSSSSDENNEVRRRLDFEPTRLQVGESYTREQIKDSNGADIPMNIDRSKYIGCVGSYKCIITAFPLMKAVQCKPCDHVFSYVGLRQWLNKERTGYNYTNRLCPLCNREIDRVYVMKNEDLTEFMINESIDKIDEELSSLELNCKDYENKKKELEAAKRKLEFQKLYKERMAARTVQENTNSQLKF